MYTAPVAGAEWPLLMTLCPDPMAGRDHASLDSVHVLASSFAYFDGFTHKQELLQQFVSHTGTVHGIKHDLKKKIILSTDYFIDSQ